MRKIWYMFPRFIRSRILRTVFFIRFCSDFIRFRKKIRKDNRFLLRWGDRNPQLFDRTSTTGFDVHYIYHPAWAARIIAETKPKEHIDISSTLTFCSMLSAFIPTRFYDYRPAQLTLSNLHVDKEDLSALSFPDESISSLSCMHTVEHVGLGRYGDPINPTGDIAAAKELARVLAQGGNLLFVVPVGKPKIAFNAHRIYSYDQVLALFPSLTLKEFSLIPDNALTEGMAKNATKKQSDAQVYGCGCFWFTKA